MHENSVHIHIRVQIIPYRYKLKSSNGSNQTAKFKVTKYALFSISAQPARLYFRKFNRTYQDISIVLDPVYQIPNLLAARIRNIRTHIGQHADAYSPTTYMLPYIWPFLSSPHKWMQHL